jgi:hypothetical protein
MQHISITVCRSKKSAAVDNRKIPMKDAPFVIMFFLRDWFFHLM